LTDNVAPASPTLRDKVLTGYGRLDEVLQGGFLPGTAVVLNAPASDEVPLLVGNYLSASRGEASLLICRGLSALQAIPQHDAENVKFLICGETV
jgi:hypothetical protein